MADISASSEPPAPDQQTQATVFRADLPFLWADAIRFTHKKNQDMELAVFTFMSQLPESVEGATMIETAKVTTSAAHAKRMIDLMARVLNHYPEKPANAESSAR